MSFNVLVLTLAFHTYLAYIVSNAKMEPLFETQIKVQPINDNEKKEEKFIENKLMKHARQMNTIGKVAFAVIMVIFKNITDFMLQTRISLAQFKVVVFWFNWRVIINSSPLFAPRFDGVKCNAVLVQSTCFLCVF